tara:strand:+ start:404 stop:1693 length:1290 start_codon:yes stop_codon:yes gene_type:complete
MAIPPEFASNPLKWAMMPIPQRQVYLHNLPIDQKKAAIDTLNESEKRRYFQYKAYVERTNERIARDEYLKAVEKPTGDGKTKPRPKTSKRGVQAKLNTATIKWMRDNGHGDLIEPLRKHIRGISKVKGDLAQSIRRDLDLAETNRGHTISLEGSPTDASDNHLLRLSSRTVLNQTLTPTTALEVRGADTEGYVESARANRRHGAVNLFSLKVLQRLNRPVNQLEAAQNFILNRPDKVVWTSDQEIAESVKMGRLAVGEVGVDALELEEFLENDLRKAGLLRNRQNKGLLKQLINRENTKDMILSAKDRRSGKNPWDVTLKRRLRDDEVKQRFFARKPLPKTTYLPSEATGSTWPHSLLRDAAADITKIEQQKIKRELKTQQKIKMQSNKNKYRGTGFGGIGRQDDDTHLDAIGPNIPIHYIRNFTNVEL